MTIYFPDISPYQAGIDLAGALAVAIKATEGSTYRSPQDSAQRAEADRHGAFRLSYHFLRQGNGARQADHFWAATGRVPAMLDFEPVKNPDTGEYVSRPTVGDATAFTDRLRSHGGVLYWLYFPRWYWQELGRPSMKPLTSRGLLLWSSHYARYSDDSSAAGWQPYGGVWPLVWQYSSTIAFGGKDDVDFNAFRGSVFAGQQDKASVAATLAEFKSLSLTGKWPGQWTYAAPAALTASPGAHSVLLAWKPPAPPPGEPPAEYRVWIYKGKVCNRDTLVQSYPRHGITGTRHLFGSLDPAVTGTRVYTAHVAACGEGGTHLGDHVFASVTFTVSG